MDHQKGRPGGRPAHTRGESRESYCSLASSASPEVAAAWALYSSAVSLPSASASAASKTWVSAGTVATSALLRLPSLSTSRSAQVRSEEHTSELQSLMRISYAVFCLKK